MAVTIPEDEPMVATPVLLLLHVPPVVASVSGVVAATHDEVGPEMGDNALTVSMRVAKQPPGIV